MRTSGRVKRREVPAMSVFTAGIFYFFFPLTSQSIPNRLLPDLCQLFTAAQEGLYRGTERLRVELGALGFRV